MKKKNIIMLMAMAVFTATTILVGCNKAVEENVSSGDPLFEGVTEASQSQGEENTEATNAQDASEENTSATESTTEPEEATDATEEVTQPDPEAPATPSQTIITSLLREELGWNGVVITDAFQMDALAGYSQHDAVIAAIRAGCDIILCPDDPAAAMRTILDNFDEERIDESVYRILTLKLQNGITT